MATLRLAFHSHLQHEDELISEAVPDTNVVSGRFRRWRRRGGSGPVEVFATVATRPSPGRVDGGRVRGQNAEEKKNASGRLFAMNGWRSSFSGAHPAPQHTTTMQDPSPNPDTHTHINAHSHTLAHTPCPREDTGEGGWMGFPNYLSRFQQMVKNFLQGRAVAPAARTFAPPATSDFVSPQKPFHSCVLGTQRLFFLHRGLRHPPFSDGAGVNHAFRLSDTFSGAGGGVLQGESDQRSTTPAPTHTFV